MARIQILELPTEVVGDYVRTPFALVIDQVDVETEEVRGAAGPAIRERVVAELTQHEANQIAERLGAVGAILVANTLNVAR
jgi:hypothetical protein